MSKSRCKQRRVSMQKKKFKKWCKRICQTIKNKNGFPTKAKLQLHFLRNPQKNKPGICAEYTTRKLFEIFENGKIVQIGEIQIDGASEDIIEDILKQNYYLI